MKQAILPVPNVMRAILPAGDFPCPYGFLWERRVALGMSSGWARLSGSGSIFPRPQSPNASGTAFFAAKERKEHKEERDPVPLCDPCVLLRQKMIDETQPRPEFSVPPCPRESPPASCVSPEYCFPVPTVFPRCSMTNLPQKSATNALLNPQRRLPPIRREAHFRDRDCRIVVK